MNVSDGEASGAATAPVVVLSSLQGIAVLNDAVASLAGSGGPLGAGELNSLRAKLTAASATCRRDNAPACGNTLGAFSNELQAMVNSGRVSADAATPLLRYAQRVIASIGG